MNDPVPFASTRAMTAEQLALVSELQSQKLAVMCERDDYKKLWLSARTENDALRQHCQVVLITGAAILHDMADNEDRRLFVEALEKIAAYGGRRA